MSDEQEVSESNVGFTVRDLVVKANTKLDALGGEMKEIRAEQVQLRTDVDRLKTEQAVNAAKRGNTTDFRRAAYAVLVLAAYWFGPVIDKAITH